MAHTTVVVLGLGLQWRYWAFGLGLYTSGPDMCA